MDSLVESSLPKTSVVLCSHAPVVLGAVRVKLTDILNWLQIVDRQLAMSIVFEDDIRFEPHFRQKLVNLMEEVDRLLVDWDLM